MHFTIFIFIWQRLAGDVKAEPGDNWGGCQSMAKCQFEIAICWALDGYKYEQAYLWSSGLSFHHKLCSGGKPQNCRVSPCHEPVAATGDLNCFSFRSSKETHMTCNQQNSKVCLVLLQSSSKPSKSDPSLHVKLERKTFYLRAAFEVGQHLDFVNICCTLLDTHIQIADLNSVSWSASVPSLICIWN